MKSNPSTSRSSSTTTSPRPPDGRGIEGEDRSVAAAPAIFFPAVVLPQGDGSFLVKPGKPIVGEHWISLKEAMKILGIPSRGTMHTLRNSPGLGEMIRWKFTTHNQGKVAYEVNSLWAYRRALEDLDK